MKIKEESKEITVNPKSPFQRKDVIRFFLHKPSIISIDDKLKKIYRITN